MTDPVNVRGRRTSAGEPGLGYRRVHGELRRLGHQISEATMRWPTSPAAPCARKFADRSVTRLLLSPVQE